MQLSDSECQYSPGDGSSDQDLNEDTSLYLRKVNSENGQRISTMQISLIEHVTLPSQFSQKSLPKLSNWAGSIGLTPLQTALAAAAKPDVLSLAMGLPDPHFFPTKAIAAAATKVIGSNGAALQYSLPCTALKEKICAYMASRGVNCSADCILLTHGAQEALHLLCKLLLNSDSSVIEEEVSYPGFQHLVDSFQSTIIAVPTTGANGVDVDAIEQKLHGGEKPAFIYLMPTAHNPLGNTLSMQKRLHLAQIARKFQVPIIEDDPYGSLYYDLEPMPCIKAFEQDWVYYVGSMSKILGPSLRIGWIIAPKEHIRTLSAIKEAMDLDVSTLSQWVVNEYLEREDIHSHINKLRAAYRDRRDAMHAALLANMPSSTRWTIPDSGVFFWVDLPPSCSSTKLFDLCLTQQRVAFLPGGACSRGQRSNGMRLNFSSKTPDQITEGITRIGKMLAGMELELV